MENLSCDAVCGTAPSMPSGPTPKGCVFVSLPTVFGNKYIFKWRDKSVGLEASSLNNYSSVISCFKIWCCRYQPPGITGIAGAQLAQLDPGWRDPVAPLEWGGEGKDGQTTGKFGEDVSGRMCLRLSNQRMRCKRNTMVISVILTFLQLIGKPWRCMVWLRQRWGML